MKISSYETFKEQIDFLLAYTTYEESYLNRLQYDQLSLLFARKFLEIKSGYDSEWIKRTCSNTQQLIATCTSIKRRMAKTITDIFEANPDLASDPKFVSYILSMTSRELTQAKKTYLPKSNSRKKIAKVEEAPKKTISQAEQVSFTDFDVYSSSDDHEEFLEPDELFLMFGFDSMNYSEEALNNMGIHVDNEPSGRTLLNKKVSELRVELIDFILKAHLRNTNNKFYSRETLGVLTLDELKFLYNQACSKLPGLPSLIELEDEIRFGK